MRLVEYLYLDPGLAPSQPACPPPGDEIARLTGEPVQFYSSYLGGPTVYDEMLARKYRHFLSEEEGLDEVLKNGRNVHSGYDNRVIGKLKNGKYPGRAEDGKGFCFVWADGRGICAFRYRGDALRWVQEEPRDIVKFWYGEPVSPSGKFRVPVRDRYRPSQYEGVRTFSDVLAERGRR